MVSKSENGALASGWVDTHVHVFSREGALAADRRYTPDYDATPAQLLSQMRPAGIGHAVLVQPSFLGTDNSYLLQAIAADPDSFSGIAVVEPAISRPALAALHRAGVRGVRLNCIGRVAPDFAGTHRDLVRSLAALDMVLQLQAEGEQWGAMADFLADPPGRVVVDHFGRTPQASPSAGFEHLLRAAGMSDRLWFKVSAPYRLQPGAANACAAAIVDCVGAGRIVWGSDWPHTQFEGRHAYHETLGWLSEWVPGADERHAVLTSNPARLLGLG